MEKGGQLRDFKQCGGVRCHQLMEFQMTQRGALSIGVTVWGEEVIPQEDWKDDAGEFLHVGGAAIVKS